MYWCFLDAELATGGMELLLFQMLFFRFRFIVFASFALLQVEIHYCLHQTYLGY